MKQKNITFDISFFWVLFDKSFLISKKKKRDKIQNNQPKFSFFPQKAEVLKKGKSKNTDEVNKILIKLTFVKIFFKIRAKMKKIINDMMVVDN